MLDVKHFRQDITDTAAQLARRGYVLEVDKISALEEQRKVIQVRTQQQIKTYWCRKSEG